METFSLERSGANLILHISEELDHHTAGQLSRTIDVLIEKGNVKNIVVDFDGMTFMDSSGIGLVMGRYRIMKELGGCIQVVNTSPHITRVMKLAGLERLDVLSKGGKTK